MKYKMPKRCGECRASVHHRGSASTCELRFKTKTVYSPAPFRLPMSCPAEPCLKPLTIAEYFEAVEIRRGC